MGKNRKKSTKWSADELFIAALIFPIALICAYPIILVWILVLVGAVILCAFLGNSSERKKKKKMQKAAAEFDKLRSELDHSIIEDATKIVVSRKDKSISPLNEYKKMKEQEKIDEELEREAYRDELRYVWGLTEYQIGLVESGEYELCQFSEEELEDDDYYSEEEL